MLTRFNRSLVVLSAAIQFFQFGLEATMRYGEQSEPAKTEDTSSVTNALRNPRGIPRFLICSYTNQFGSLIFFFFKPVFPPKLIKEASIAIISSKGSVLTS